MKELGLEEFLIEANQVNFKQLKLMVESLLSNKDEIQMHIKNSLPEIKQNASKSARLIRTYYENNSK